MFLAHCTTAFLALTNPVSSMQKPAAISITRKPWTRKENELKIYAVSASGAADATPMKPIIVAGINKNNLNILDILNLHFVFNLLITLAKSLLEN